MGRGKKHSAASIRRLAPCHGSIAQQGQRHAAHTDSSSCPAWGMASLGPSHRQQGQHQDVFQSGLQGQSVLALPLRDVDLSVKLPPGLQLAATSAGHLDCRMQLLGVQLDWPATGAAADPSQPTPQLLPARSSAAGFACRSGALMLAHALFPDHTHHLLAWLAVPVAVADALGVLADAVPSSTQQAVRSKAQALKAQLQKQQQADSLQGAAASRGIGWVDGVQGVVAGSLHTFRSLSGPAAALATGSWLWSMVSPSSHMLCSAVVALMAVAADYNSLGTDVAKGRIPPGKAVEAAWRARHKAAAQRLAEYCKDLPPEPPLAPFIQLAGHCSIAAGLAFDGQGLCGHLPSSLSAPTASVLTSDWPPGAAAAAGLRGFGGGFRCGGAGSTQLVVAGSVAADRPGAHRPVHEAAGLSRAQLLELFTGSSSEDVAAAPAAPSSSSDDDPVATVAHQGNEAAGAAGAARAPARTAVGAEACSSSRPAAVRPGCAAGLPLLASTVGASSSAAAAAAASPAALRMSTDSASDRSVDAVIRIKQRPRDVTKPDRATRGSNGGSSGNGGNGGSSSNGSASRALSRTSSSAELAALQQQHNHHHSPSQSDPLEFLDGLPLYGQQDHAHLLAVQAAAAAAAAAASAAEAAGYDDDHAVEADATDLGVCDAMSCEPSGGGGGGVLEAVTLCLRGAYLLLVFTPFLLAGVPMLLLSWWLLSRAAAASSQQQLQEQEEREEEESTPVGTAIVIADTSTPVSSTTSTSSSSSRLQAFQARVQHVLLTRPSELALQLLRQLLRVLMVLLTLLDLLLVLVLGGHWAAGVSAWESAGMWLRQQAWVLLHFSCSRAGAAFIKWGQWSSSRRDIFPADFCDVLSTFHDRAPVHSYRHTRRQVKAALGVEVEQLFDSFQATPLASGSIAQVHKATLKPDAYRQYIQQPPTLPQQPHHPAAAAAAEQQVVVVKVCHPNVAEHIRLDFKLVALLSAAASRLPVLRGLPLRESVAQFSHTMTAQTDLRVEAVHALRFHNNFAGVQSSVSIPRPIPGLVSSTVLVESFEAGQSVAVFMKEPHAINTQIVALGVDAYLKMLLTDNFVHTDLHPGNILFRSVPAGPAARGQAQQQQRREQQQSRPLWRRLLPWGRAAAASSSNNTGQAEAEAEDEIPQWERELEALSAQHQQRWVSRHGVSRNAVADEQETAAGDSTGSSSSESGSAAVDAPPEVAQLVLLDFGLAEQLTPQVRYHFISFLNAISAGDGLAASHHLLRWSSQQTCPDKAAFRCDMLDLFSAACDIHSPQGIDLDSVMTAVLGLARKHGVTIDSCYASLVISVCVLVGFAKALDPQVNLMDAATPTLLAYGLTGQVVGRLYS